MRKRESLSRRVFVRGALAAGAGLALGGCGYLLYPERRGQTSKSQLDATVVILDGLLVLLAVVPGVIAFIVDASSGTLYLPAGGKSIRKVRVGSRKWRKIQEALDRELGGAVDLHSGEVLVWRGGGEIGAGALSSFHRLDAFDSKDFVPGDRVVFESDAQGHATGVRVV